MAIIMHVNARHILQAGFLGLMAMMLVATTDAQSTRRSSRNFTRTPNEVVVEEPPKPVIIDGKAAEDLSEDEMLDFLQTKIQEVDQSDGQVRILKVAPGYPLTILFNQSFQDVIVGDKGMVDIAKTARGMVVTATARKGDTPMQVMFSGGRRLIYHIIIAENFKDGMTSIRVNFLRKTAATSSGMMARDGGINVRYIATVISNYDALKQEKAIDSQNIKRFPIFRKSKVTPFTYYDVFRFQDGTVAITFAVENRYDQAVRINESKLRIVLGNMEFIPDYTSINHLKLEPGEKTTGFVIIAKTPFTLNQPFELNWR